MSMLVQKSQDHKMARLQDGIKRLCLVDDLKKLKITYKSSQGYKLKPKNSKDCYIKIHKIKITITRLQAKGDGTVMAKKKEGEDEATWIEIPERQRDDEYLKEREILTPRNDDVDAINAYMFKKLAGDSVTYNSADEICKASTDTLDQHNLYPLEFLNTLKFPGMPPHALCLKKELPIILLRNVNPSKGLCNRTRLIIADLGQFGIWAKILIGSHVGDNVLIHRIILT
uniref:DNA helicase Pif1-like 2B domain-containing protein n=1 Tax=Tanacetum cinerariifolium TaxID=118510 RepID=A0A6L2LPR8_TANCI|nr:hypothetical protein [Tanacetum cinerariifolium]